MPAASATSKIDAADFAIGLAETPWWRLPLRLPASAALSLARRDPSYLRETAKYLAGPLYRRRLDAKTARAEARRPPPRTERLATRRRRQGATLPRRGSSA